MFNNDVKKKLKKISVSLSSVSLRCQQRQHLMRSFRNLDGAVWEPELDMTTSDTGDAIHYTVKVKKKNEEKDGPAFGLTLQRDKDNNLWSVEEVEDGSTADVNNIRKGDFLIHVQELEMEHEELRIIQSKMKELPVELSLRREKRRKSRSALQSNDVPILFEAHAAAGIKNVQFLTSQVRCTHERVIEVWRIHSFKQDPYVLVYPIPSKKYISQSAYHNSGHVNPTWHCQMGSQMLVLADQNDTALKVSSFSDLF